MIEIFDVSHRLGNRVLFDRLSIRLPERRIAVIGANGSGKSSFVRLLNGLLMPDDGVVRVFDLDVRARTRDVRRDVGFVFQNPDSQIVMPTVAEDIAFGLKQHGFKGAALAERLEATLERYDLGRLRDQPAHLLSGGEKQLLALAAVLAIEPRLVVLDEPTTLLDLRNKRAIRRLVEGLAQVVVMVTHDLDLVADFDRALLFDDGRVVADGAPREVASTYEALMA